PGVGGIGDDEGEQLQVGTVSKGDQRVLRPDRVLPAADDGEAELPVARHRSLEVGNDDDEVVDSGQHPTAGMLRSRLDSGAVATCAADIAYDISSIGGEPCGTGTRIRTGRFISSSRPGSAPALGRGAVPKAAGGATAGGGIRCSRRAR